MSKALRERLRRFKADFPWSLYQALGVNNARIDRHVRPLALDALPDLPGLSRGRLEVSLNEYRRVTALPGMERFRRLAYVHDKALEYAVSLKLLDPAAGAVLLDAAGGHGEFAQAALRLYSLNAAYCLDSVGYPERPARPDLPRRLRGDVSAIPLPDASLDAVSCHHSFEHFQGDADTAFIRELGRVLRPGGRACLVPLFLSGEYYELWNIRTGVKYDESARTLYDPLGTFPGWGPCEGFARVYDPGAFARRVLAPAKGLRASLIEIHCQGAPAPDLSRNRHQPRVNGLMKALFLEKPVPGSEA